MAGTATSWKTAAIAQNAGQLWGNLAIPGAGARLTLATDGTPDASANSSAVHLGATKAGAKLMIKPTFQKFNVDEFRAPVVTNISTLEMGISCELVGITDFDLMTLLLPGVGSYSTSTGYKEISVGSKAIVYQSIALIFPLIEDVTKFGIFHLYSAINDAGVAWAQGRTELGFTPVNLVAYEITTRAAADTLGAYWKQI